jgi:hypothetical protein
VYRVSRLLDGRALKGLDRGLALRIGHVDPHQVRVAERARRTVVAQRRIYGLSDPSARVIKKEEEEDPSGLASNLVRVNPNRLCVNPD